MMSVSVVHRVAMMVSQQVATRVQNVRTLQLERLLQPLHQLRLSECALRRLMPLQLRQIRQENNYAATSTQKIS